MFKTSEKQLVRENNFRVAYYIPPNTQPPSGAATSSISKIPAVVTRQDLVTTSKYAAYHRQMGHTPPNLVAVNSQQKKRLIETSNLPTAELKHKRLFVVMDMSIQHKKQKKEVNKHV